MFAVVLVPPSTLCSAVSHPWRPTIHAPRAPRVCASSSGSSGSSGGSSSSGSRSGGGGSSSSRSSSSGDGGGGGGASTPGHLFVVHGDLRRILANDVLYPTQSFSHPVWFPDGPPDGAWPVEPTRFTRTNRVHRVEGLADGQPCIWLSHVSWEGLSTAPVDWFLDAAEQFLESAADAAESAGTRGIGGRLLPVLALPVVGTGGAGGKGISGELLTELLKLLQVRPPPHRRTAAPPHLRTLRTCTCAPCAPCALAHLYPRASTGLRGRALRRRGPRRQVPPDALGRAVHPHPTRATCQRAGAANSKPNPNHQPPTCG